MSKKNYYLINCLIFEIVFVILKVRITPVVFVQVIAFERTDALNPGSQTSTARTSLLDRTFERQQRLPT